MASERARLDGAGKLVAWSVATAAYLFALPFWLPLLFDLDGADLLVRAGLCVLVLSTQKREWVERILDDAAIIHAPEPYMVEPLHRQIGGKRSRR
jgi:hypothetical protein